ncbi:hypothetical protein BJV74DRAFT_881808 [Russula compacta]|nr:hypothetical protein BJV74DRAFT_881808 [Russula compacta]
MPLASSGLSSSMMRQAARVIHNHPPNIPSSRSLHTPSFAPRGTPHQPSHFTSRVLQRTRAIFNGFVGHLTTPGTLRAPGASPRSVHSVVSRMPKIETNLSLPVRHALSVRMGAQHLPRPPAVPHGIAQVGLGTARNFSTGRPIFQNIADKMHNIPVASRAFLEADLDMRSKDDHALALKLKHARRKSKKRSRRACASSKVHFHPTAAAATRPTVVPVPEPSAKAKAETKFDQYFAPAQVPEVSTTLIVPLAPTPTSRVPLAHTFAYDRHPLIPFLEISTLHVDAERHASRVRVLFEQLDAAQAWDKGVTCETLGGARGAGILRIRFAGWSAYAVRGILGEAATGWCILEEERAEECGNGEQDEAAMSMSEVSSAMAPDDPGLAELDLSSPIEPAYSFVLPTLDFSASVAVSPPTDFAPGAGTDVPFSDMASNVSPSDFDMFSDFGYVSDGSSAGGDLNARDWIEPPDALHSPRTASWVGLSFSSAFSQRLEEGPREDMF